MASYAPTTNFRRKDTLPTTDPERAVTGAELQIEFDNISRALNSMDSGCYELATDFRRKDLLPTGDADKDISGIELDVEFGLIAVAIQNIGFSLYTQATSFGPKDTSHAVVVGGDIMSEFELIRDAIETAWRAGGGDTDEGGGGGGGTADTFTAEAPIYDLSTIQTDCSGHGIQTMASMRLRPYSGSAISVASGFPANLTFIGAGPYTATYAAAQSTTPESRSVMVLELTYQSDNNVAPTLITYGGITCSFNHTANFVAAQYNHLCLVMLPLRAVVPASSTISVTVVDTGLGVLRAAAVLFAGVADSSDAFADGYRASVGYLAGMGGLPLDQVRAPGQKAVAGDLVFSAIFSATAEGSDSTTPTGYSLSTETFIGSYPFKAAYKVIT